MLSGSTVSLLHTRSSVGGHGDTAPSTAGSACADGSPTLLAGARWAVPAFFSKRRLGAEFTAGSDAGTGAVQLGADGARRRCLQSFSSRLCCVVWASWVGGSMRARNLVLVSNPRTPLQHYKSIEQLMCPRSFISLLYGIDFKCRYSNRPLKPFNPLNRLTQYLFSGT